MSVWLLVNMRNKSRYPSVRRIMFAFGVSLLLHLVLLFRVGGFTSSVQMSKPGGRLQISLASPEKKQPESSVIPAPAKIDVIATSKNIEVLAQAQTAALPSPEPVKKIQAIPASAPSDKMASQFVGTAQKTDQSVGMTQLGLIGPARQVDIEFEVFSGSEKKSRGLGRHSYVSDGGENFTLSAKSMSKPEMVDQGEQWQLEIVGRINRYGLSPTAFMIKGDVPELLMSLKGDPPSANERSGRMPDGILDRQSLLYQFMHHPPVEGGGGLWLSDGSKYAGYTYRIDGFESLTIASLGLVRTMKLIISSDKSPEIIELWLIPGQRYLPAKMRHTDTRGVVTEQVVLSLSAK